MGYGRRIKKKGEHSCCPIQLARVVFFLKNLLKFFTKISRLGFEFFINSFLKKLSKGRQARRHGQRISRKSSCLIYSAQMGKFFHHIFSSPIGSHRKPASYNFPKTG